MNIALLFLLATFTYAQTDLSELKKLNTSESFAELQKKIKPGRLSGEKAERLNQMIKEGKYILPPKSEVLKVHEEVQLKSVISASHKDIEQNIEPTLMKSDDSYGNFLTHISESGKVHGPKQTDVYTENASSDINVENKDEMIQKLYGVMATKDGEKSDTQFQIFHKHSEAYKARIIPLLIQSLK